MYISGPSGVRVGYTIDMEEPLKRLNAWLYNAENDLLVMRDGISWALSFSLVHLVANILALEPQGSHLRDCPSASFSSLVLGIIVLTTVTASMAYRSVYGSSTLAEMSAALINIVATSILAMLSKQKGFFAGANDRDECSVLVGFAPSLLGWALGEFGAILSGAVWLLAWRRNPPCGLNPWVAIAFLGGVGIALVFLADLVVAPSLKRLMEQTVATNATE